MKTLIFLWENLGPMHDDRIVAVSQHFKGNIRCIGVQEVSRSDIYEWDATPTDRFEKITLSTAKKPTSMQLLAALMRQEMKTGKAVWFLCNYDKLHVALFSFYLRLRLRKVYLMGCSKFDDSDRSLAREMIKFLVLLPYLGVITSGLRSKDYFRFLSFRPVVGEYNTLSVDRIQTLSSARPAPQGMNFEDRDFLIVARLVEKKNISLALHAFAKFRQISNSKRKLVICGSGNLLAELTQLSSRLGIADHVVFKGFVQTEGIAQILANSLALILPSLEEQFGNVIIEAQAMGLPVLVSTVCGARDLLVKSWVNGFVFEPDNSEGLAHFMDILSSDKSMWERMCINASASSALGDSARFAEGVAVLTQDKI